MFPAFCSVRPSWLRHRGLEGARGRQATWEIPAQKWCQVLFAWPPPGDRGVRALLSFPLPATADASPA